MAHNLRFVFLMICLLIPVLAMPQRSGKQTFIMNNGTTISGVVLSDSGDFYTVKISSPQLVHLPVSSVSSVEEFRKDNSNSGYRGGYYIHVSANILAGKTNGDKSVKAGLHLSNGYQFLNGLGAGIGTGIEDMNMTLLPVYADLTYHPFNSRVSPFLFLKSGYAFSLLDDKADDDWYGLKRTGKGGFMINAGGGILLYTGERFGVNLGIGYRYQKVTVTETAINIWSNYSTHYVTNFNRFEMQLGFVFR